jgi:CRP-like cAMP-binding protein
MKLDEMRVANGTLKRHPSDYFEIDQGRGSFVLRSESSSRMVHEHANRKHSLPSQITTLSSGDYFGEISLLSHQPRTASVLATGDVTVLALSKEGSCPLLKLPF